jgi:hypothetical protein
MFIVLDPVDGPEFFDTAEEAAAFAQSLIDASLVDGEWAEEVELVEWGEYVCRAEAKECNRRESTHGCDYDCDYELRPTEEQSEAVRLTEELERLRSATRIRVTAEEMPEPKPPWVVLAWDGSEDAIEAGHWSLVAINDIRRDHEPYTYTHWMPLPERPAK